MSVLRESPEAKDAFRRDGAHQREVQRYAERMQVMGGKARDKHGNTWLELSAAKAYHQKLARLYEQVWHTIVDAEHIS